MEIKLKKGIGSFQFGMGKHEVISSIGKPDIEKNDPDDANERLLIYNDLKATITFYVNEQNKLGYIRSTNKDLKYKDQKIIDLNVEDVQAILKECKKWEKETYDFFTTYFNEENWITLNVQYGKVFEIELGET